MSKIICNKYSDSIVEMILNKPERRNALDADMMDELNARLLSADADNDIRVVIIKGSGEHFCSGADLKMAPEGGYSIDERRAMLSRYNRVVKTILTMEKPVLSVVRGYAVGGGFFLTMASDIRIISDDVKFSCPLLKLNMSCGDLGCAYMLPRLIGDGVARDLLLTGRYMLAEEAMRLGYASQCVPRAQLDAAAMEKARLLAGYSRDALLYSKELLNIMEGVSDLDTAIKIENRNQQLVKALKREAAAQ